jgi:predicted PurR-regulated permease PerM
MLRNPFSPYGLRSVRSIASAGDGSPRRQSITEFAYRAVVMVLIAAAIFSLAYFLWRGIHVLLQAFAGVLFAVFLHALADWLSRHTRLAYRWSLAVVLVVLALAAGGLGYLLWSRISAQIGEILQTMPRSFAEIKEFLEQYPWGRYLVEQAPAAAAGLAEQGDFSRLTGLFSGVGTFLEASIVILIVGIFGAADPALYRQGLLRLVPLPQRGRAGEVLDAVAFNLRHWLLAQMLLMVIIGTTTTLGLWLIGVPQALTLGIAAGILEMVPYVGAWMAAVPAALIALLKGPEYVAFTLGLYLFLHVLEGYVLLPLMQQWAVHLPPALTIVAQVLLGKMLGVLGLFVAAPLAVVVLVLVQMLYVKDTLGDDDIHIDGEPQNPASSSGVRR